MQEHNVLGRPSSNCWPSHVPIAVPRNAEIINKAPQKQLAWMASSPLQVSRVCSEILILRYNASIVEHEYRIPRERSRYTCSEVGMQPRPCRLSEDVIGQLQEIICHHQAPPKVTD